MKRIMAFCLIGLLSACVSTTQNKPKATPVSDKNTFQGDIYPMDKPIQLKISPAQIKAQMQLIFGDQIPVTIRLKVSEFDQQLKWVIEYRGEDTQDTKITGSVITDNRGKLSKVENPFSIENGEKDDLKEFGNLLFHISFNLFLPQFSPEPVKDGDVIYIFPNLKEYFGAFGDQDLKIEITSSRVNAVLKGWAYEKGKKVLVVDIRGQSTWKDLEKSPFEMEFIVNGYSLIDPETGQIVKVELRYTPRQWKDDYFEVRYSAEIE